MYPTGPVDPTQGPSPDSASADAPFVSPSLRPPPPDPAVWQSPTPQPPRRKRHRAAWLLGSLALVAILVAGGMVWAQSRATARPSLTSGTAELSVHQLRVGDCLDPLPGSGPVSRVTTVDCGQFHAGQVVAAVELTGSYPGASEVADTAEARCAAAAAPALDVAAADQADVEAKVTYLAPSQESWQRGDTVIDCIVYADSPALKGSIVEP